MIFVVCVVRFRLTTVAECDLIECMVQKDALRATKHHDGRSAAAPASTSERTGNSIYCIHNTTAQVQFHTSGSMCKCS